MTAKEFYEHRLTWKLISGACHGTWSEEPLDPPGDDWYLGDVKALPHPDGALIVAYWSRFK